MAEFKIFWDDLTDETKEKLFKFLGEENGNYDTFPIVTLENEEDNE